MQEVDRLGWAATTAFRVGEWAIGIRSNTLEVDALLRSALVAHVLDGIVAPRNYSIAIHTDDQRGVRPLDGVWWQYSKLHQSWSAHRVVRSLLGYLGDHVDRSAAAVRLPAVTLLGPGGAIVADRSLANDKVRLLPLLRRLDLQIVDSRWAEIDDTGELVVSPLRLQVDHRVLRDLADNDRRRATGPNLAVAPGRYPVRSWLLRPSVSGSSPTKGKALTKLVIQASDVPPGGGQRTLDALARSVERASIGAVWASDLGAVESALRQISG